jgi:hypothetical protein
MVSPPGTAQNLISPINRNQQDNTLFMDSANHIDEVTNEDFTNREIDCNTRRIK